MVVEQLKADYGALYRTLEREHLMRLRVFPLGHKDRTAKLAEISEALAALERIKDLLKAQLGIFAEQEQQLTLLDDYTTSVPAERKEFQ